jgi:hypothetical protein
MELSALRENINLFFSKRRRISSLLIVFLLLFALFLTVELVQRRQLWERKAVGESSSLALPDTLTVNLGEQFVVPVYLNTDNAEIGGVDVVLNFSTDMNKISLVNIQPDAQAGTSLKTFIPVDVSGNFDSQAVINNANLTGKVEFGAVTYDNSIGQPTNPFDGILSTTNPLATLTFQVSPDVTSPTQATITVVHTPGVTIDSNIVSLDSVADILAQANSLTINVGGQPLSLSPGWNEIMWPDVLGKKASDVPDVCPIAVAQENFWLRPYVKNYGGKDFNFESGKTYYLHCTQSFTWAL